MRNPSELLDATVLYRSDMPEFPESISVRGGHMKWNYHQNRWKKDNTTEVVKFDERSIPLPDLTTILINKIPNDRKGRAQFVKLSPMTRALLELIADSPRCGKFEKQRELIALVEAKVDPSRPQRAQYIEQIKKTPMDFKK